MLTPLKVVGHGEIEVNDCVLCGRKVEGYYMCESCREYVQIFDGGVEFARQIKEMV